ncbi:CPA_1a_G0028860.mRNA.1.CDS.1 [Saccharomyces cerevisiae]|nr:CPA_1a_G0028860.mRNA.1.CDS.1 [Saccharomyces cerevisiae]CAI7353285.1 CPA_1a_G0028860.mRNA.1.CDS.1 [Saccharomyces cerevisiae]
MSIISSWLLVSIICLTTSTVTKLQAAGVTTHLFYLTRGAPLSLKENYYPWLKAGSFFPDALYSCAPSNKDWSDFAEFTHWPNFLMIAVSYWQQKVWSELSTSGISRLTRTKVIFNRGIHSSDS